MRAKLVLAVALFSLLRRPGSAARCRSSRNRSAAGRHRQLAPGTGLLADIDLDASSAEGGNLFGGASEIHIVPLGDAVLTRHL